MPVLTGAFERIGATLDRLEHGQIAEVVTVGCNSTFANGWLLQHLDEFRARHPLIDLRLLINNNRVDVAGDGLDLALRFGNGLWHGTEAVHLLPAPLAPVCAPATAQRLSHPADLARETLLRSYRVEEWPLWFEMTDTPCPTIRGPMFDSSVTMAEAAAQGLGVALVPVCMFQRDLAAERLVQPFEVEVPAGSYCLTWLKSKTLTPGMSAFRDWLLLKLGRDRGP
jgi:LysR family transcriptional regulator of beta-lactamase